MVLQLAMAAIAKWWIGAMLAPTQINSFSFLRSERLGFKRRSLMGTVTKRLLAATPATTPIIGLTFLNLNGIRFLLCYNHVITHGMSPFGNLRNSPKL